MVLTIRTDDEQETLPVFSSGEEAEIFLRFGAVTGGCRVRRSSAGELVSVLSGPCVGVKKVALDPSPEMVVEGMVRLVSLLRESFINSIMTRRSGPFRSGEPEELAVSLTTRTSTATDKAGASPDPTLKASRRGRS